MVESLAPEIARDLFRRKRPRSPIESRAGMRARATYIKVADRRRIARKAEQRAHDEHLIERELAVEDVTAGQAVRALEIKRCDDLARNYRRFEAGRIARDRASRGVAKAIALGIPGRAAQVIRRVLDVRRDDVPARGREERVGERRNRELD